MLRKRTLVNLSYLFLVIFLFAGVYCPCRAGIHPLHSSECHALAFTESGCVPLAETTQANDAEIPDDCRCGSGCCALFLTGEKTRIAVYRTTLIPSNAFPQCAFLGKTFPEASEMSFQKTRPESAPLFSGSLLVSFASLLI